MATLTEAHKQTLKETWVMVKAKGPLEDTGLTMFVKLFQKNPELLPIFPFADEGLDNIPKSARVKRHGANVMKMVDTAISILDDMDTVAAALTDLGKRHRRYKATPAHFGPVGDALLATLEEGLKDAWTPEVKEAWVTIFGIITTVMSAQLS